MTNINLSQENYTDYVGSKFFASLGVNDVAFTPKYAPATDRNPVPAILVHVSGVQEGTGVLVNFDMWPRYEFEDEDLEKFFTKEGDNYVPKGNLADIHFRIGYWVETDGKEKVVREGKPKWLAYVSNGKVCRLSGEAREFGGATI